MSSHTALSRGVAIPPDEIHSALRSAAVPGFTGVLQIELLVDAEAARHVSIAIIRRQSKSVNETTREEVPAVGDHPRKKNVQKVVDDLRSKLFLRTAILAIEAHYVDGEVRKVTTAE